MTYDPEADAALVYLGRGKTPETVEIKSDLIVDDDADGRILGLEILSASRQLAPGRMVKRPAPGCEGRPFRHGPSGTGMSVASAGSSTGEIGAQDAACGSDQLLLELFVVAL